MVRRATKEERAMFSGAIPVVFSSRSLFAGGAELSASRGELLEDDTDCLFDGKTGQPDLSGESILAD